MVATSFQIHSEVDTSLQANLRADSAGGKKISLWHKNFLLLFLGELNVIGKGIW